MTDTKSTVDFRRTTRGKGAGRRQRGATSDDAIRDLQERVDFLTLSMGTITGYEKMVNLLDNGLAGIAAELQPLRDLTPVRIGDPLGEPVITALRVMRTALDRPDWSAAGSISIADQNVPFIGEPSPRARVLERRVAFDVEPEMAR